MQVIVDSKGFCQGVERAVKMAREAAKKYGQVYTLGDLIHNSYAVNMLREEGVIPIYSIDEIKRGDNVIISAHGTTLENLKALREKGANVIDATCKSVEIIHKKVKEYSDKGYFIIIVGKDTHAEVRGIATRAKEYIVTLDADTVELKEDKDLYLVVFQTTLSTELYEKFKKRLEKLALNHAKTVEFFNSICYTTIVKQRSALKIAKECQAVFVIGDKKSSNTRTLLDIAAGQKSSYLICGVNDLSSVTYIKNITKLGIIASASAPKELVMEVINRMEQDNKLDIVQNENVEAQVSEIAIEKKELSEEAVSVKEEAVKEAEETAKSEEAVKLEETAENAEDKIKSEDVAVQAEEAEKADDAAVSEVKPKKLKQELTMEMAMNSSRYSQKLVKEGARLKARIVSVDQNGVSVAVEGTGKNDSGFIDKSEMELDGSYNLEAYAVGDVLDVVVIPKTDSKMKGTNLSKRQYDAIKIEDEAVKKILQGEEFTLSCNKSINGGLLGKLGTYTIFVPASQIRMGYVKNLDEYVDKKLRLRILPPKEEEKPEGEPVRKPNPKRIVASQRVILEEEKAAREEAFWEVMKVNNIIKGKVKRFTPFGAFVSIMNFDCLAHISDLSWIKIKDPSEVLEINKSYDFLVIKADREAGKVSLGYKQLQQKPYEIAAEKYHVGDVIKGRVERIKDFGAFVAIEPGIDGLVHVSEIGHKWVANANEALKIGDEIDAKIIGFENNKITLSIKALIEPEQIEEEVVEDEVAEGEEKKSGKSAMAKFNKRMEGAESKGDKRDRKSKKGDKDEDDDTPREWVSTQKSGATLADLFKNQDFDINKFDE